MTKEIRRNIEAETTSPNGRGKNFLKNVSEFRNSCEGASRRANAFTLAEVLITLAVIGIVCLLTIPNLVNSYKEKQRITRIKKTYSVLNHAYQMAVIKYGLPHMWSLTKTDTGLVDDSGNAILDKAGVNIVALYLGEFLRKGSTDTFSFDTIKNVAGVQYKNETTTLTLSEDNPGIILPDGTFIRMGYVDNALCSGNLKRCSDILVYLPEKKQQVGVTQLYFYLTKDGIVPAGTVDDTVYSFATHCDRKNESGLGNSYQGRGCTAWVIEKGNMDYLHCDDLSWDGKSKCD